MSQRVLDRYAFPELEVGDQDYRWAFRYAHDVLTGKIVAGRYIKLACKRFFDDLNRDELYFDVEAAKSVVLWFKFIPITDGAANVVGKPTVLLPWQIWLCCSLVSFKWKATGFRKYKYAYVQVGRKNGKSTLAGGLTLYFMYKSGYFKPRAYSVATKKDQARELWSAAHTMIELSPRLQSIFDARTNDILMPSKRGEFKPLASDSNTLDGKNPLMVNLDECHAIKDRNLYGVMVSAFGAQDEGMMLTITTAGTVLDGICTDLNRAGKYVLEGEQEQDAYFYAIYEVDKEDYEHWDDEKVWIKANPGLGFQPRLDYLRDRRIEASMSTEEKSNFLTKHLNIFVSGYDKWLDITEVKNCRNDEKPEDWFGSQAWVAVDRSRSIDLTSLVVLIPTTDGGCQTFFRNLLPRKSFNEATVHLKQVYQKAIDEGYLKLTKTNSVRDEEVKAEIDWALENFNVEMVGYDPYKMTELAEDLEKLNYPMVAVSQGTGNMSEPAKKLEGLITELIFGYNDNMLEFAATCAMAKITDQNNMKIVRDNDKTDKIDPLIAVIIALSCATLQKIDKLIYEERGLICG